MGSARKYMSFEELEKDALFWRKQERKYRLYANKSYNYYMWLAKANTAKMNAEASEHFLYEKIFKGKP